MTVRAGGLEEGALNTRGDGQTRAPETWDKGHPGAPALAVVGVTAALGLGAAASGYRWTMRILEKMMPLAAPFIAAPVPPAA